MPVTAVTAPVSGLDFTQIQADRRDTRIAYNGHAVTITYRPGAITPRFSRLVAAAKTGDETVETIINALITLVASWDVTRDGAMFPLQTDTLIDLPYAFLTAALTGIFEDFNAANPPTPGT